MYSSPEMQKLLNISSMGYVDLYFNDFFGLKTVNAFPIRGIIKMSRQENAF